MIWLVLSGCVDIGTPDYAANDPKFGGSSGSGDTAEENQWLGPNPFDPAIPRLSFGLFYEGDATDFELIDDGAAKNLHMAWWEQLFSSGRSRPDRRGFIR